jgi:serine/threonine protein kinase
VVLKSFLPVESRKDLDSFMSELNSLVALNHPCISSIVGIVVPTRVAGARIATEFVSQTSLSNVLRHESSSRWWTPTAKSIVLIGVVLAMMYAHERGVVHGRLGPSCILLDDSHRLKICDFGIKRPLRLKTGPIRRYIAPEAVKSMKAIRQADVFSFSLFLYEIITNKPDVSASDVRELIGQAVFNGQRAQDSLTSFAAGEVGIPDYVAKVIVGGLSDNPAERPSFETIFDELEEHEFKILPSGDTHTVKAFAIWVEESRISH